MCSPNHDNMGDLGVLSSLPTEEAAEFANWHWDPLRRKVAADSAPAQDRPVGPTQVDHGRTSAKDVQQALPEAARKFLRTVIDHPGKPSSAYAKLAGVGTHQAIALRRELTQQGYLREHRVNTGRRGRASIVLEPLPAALEAFGMGKGAS